jgi:hypothetical protein
MGTPNNVMSRDMLLQALNATGWVVQGHAGAATLLNVPPSTLAYRMKVLGLERPKRHVRVDHHPPVVKLLAELDALRSRARAIVHTYLPGPLRAAYLRELEVEQRAVRARITEMIASTPAEIPTGLRRPSTWDQWR